MCRLNLSSRLYIEGLLDTEHYLGWILDKLSGCSLCHLPIALLLAQTHEKTLIASAPLGRQLAKVSLLRLKEVNGAARSRGISID